MPTPDVRSQRRYARAVVRHRTTIRELAEYTGLSPAAVSYALRGKQVSAETERRVREAAEEVGYESDPLPPARPGGAAAVVRPLVRRPRGFLKHEGSRPLPRQPSAVRRRHPPAGDPAE